jgi:hypothetical protein
MGVMKTLQNLTPASEVLLGDLQAAVATDPSDVWLVTALVEHQPDLFVVTMNYRPSLGSSYRRPSETD